MYALTHFRMMKPCLKRSAGWSPVGPVGGQVGAPPRWALPRPRFQWEDPWENDGKNGESHGSMEVSMENMFKSSTNEWGNPCEMVTSKMEVFPWEYHGI